ncbi:hypothetical protein D9619_003241 [Psilocybe cf. subviscida]|uniref:Pre-rRNA-processing protein n=1 Tax=Psilocybe cf. subviscida TaxID=2480587 RepID=A0A8H5AZ21_9AGAR|nr:hypothetical protein D9619_003241 [Psilocybe cf. subviscida]
MPKSAKKRKEKVADFSKAKLKLGKGKKAANNAIDTSFKARSIVLPSQSINVDKNDAEPITRRQLTFADLTSHLKHYNVGQRKDAILGLRELFDANWELLESCLTALVNSIVRLIGDEDTGVRKQLLAFWSWMLPKIPPEDLLPHAPLLLLFTTSAQTHIFPEIRIDAIRFLNVLLECIPSAVTSGWAEGSDAHGSRVLSGYLGILNAGTKYGGEHDGPLVATSTASVVLTPSSKLVVLNSLSTFLRIALLQADGSSSPTGNVASTSNVALDVSFLKNAFPTPEAYYAFERLMQFSSESIEKRPVLRAWEPVVSSDDDLADPFTQHFSMTDNITGGAWPLFELDAVKDVACTKDNANDSRPALVNFVAHLAATLHSTVIETYLDCAPSVFAPGVTPSETEAQLVVAVVRIARTLYHVVLHSPEHVDAAHLTRLEAIVNYMLPYFPASTRDAKLEQSHEEFNLIFCELASLVVNAARNSASSSLQRRKARRTGACARSPGQAAKTPIQTRQVMEYITRRLRGEPGSSAQIGAPISATAYRALLPTVWALINSSDGASSEDLQGSSSVINAVLDHAMQVSSKSACKRPTIEFVGSLALLSLERHQGFSIEGDAVLQNKFDAWFLHLPQVLWELGSANLPTTQLILRIILRVQQRRPKSEQAKVLASLQSRLTPYFHMDHPTRGPLVGPYKRLPSLSTSYLRRLVLDTLFTILATDRQTEASKGLFKAIGLAVAGEDEESYWSHLSVSRLYSR